MNNNYSPKKQKKYFESAYRTGSDIWTHVPYQKFALDMLPEINEKEFVLDLGIGRGLWLMELLSSGYQVLGIDYLKSMVDSLNKKIKSFGYEKKARVFVGEVEELPFAQESFSLVTDIGTFHHIHPTHWFEYLKELRRILSSRSYYLNVSFSKETKSFQGLRPKHSPNGELYKFNTLHYFFTEEEIRNVFESDFEIVKQEVKSFDSLSDPQDDVSLIFTLMKKKR